MFKEDLRHINTNSDSEVLLNVLANSIGKATQENVLTSDIIFEAVSSVYERCEGAFAVVSMINNFGLLAFRDPNGIRPLVIGVNETTMGLNILLHQKSALDLPHKVLKN